MNSDTYFHLKGSKIPSFSVYYISDVDDFDVADFEVLS